MLLTPAVFAAAPVITSPLTASGHKGVPFSYQIAASGNPTKFGSTLMAGGLGVGFLSGTVSGVPTSEGTFSGEITATNADGTGSASLVITIGPPLAAQPVITSPSTALAVLGRPFSYQISATNNPTSFSSSFGSEGLSVDPVTGVLSGTPPARPLGGRVHLGHQPCGDWIRRLGDHVHCRSAGAGDHLAAHRHGDCRPALHLSDHRE
ncbi:MAG: hypothetical protein IPL39_14120 [Opitutaceae bacterium]|nr:hypothetical protein [Opitutaceae bacterium]